MLDELDLAVLILNDVIAMQAVTILVEIVDAFYPFIALDTVEGFLDVRRLRAVRA